MGKGTRTAEKIDARIGGLLQKRRSQGCRRGRGTISEDGCKVVAS